MAGDAVPCRRVAAHSGYATLEIGSVAFIAQPLIGEERDAVVGDPIGRVFAGGGVEDLLIVAGAAASDDQRGCDDQGVADVSY
jgi:hypothetical protein